MQTPVIHYHFHLSRDLLRSPARFSRIVFESIPCFKIYDLSDLRGIQDVVDVLARQGMPHRFQKIVSKLMPPYQIVHSPHRAELIPLAACAYNRQWFFVRAYRLRQNSFFKVEATVHSDTLGKGKHYDFDKAVRSISSLFDRIDESVTPLSPIGKHMNDYFLIGQFQKEVGVLEKELKHLKQARYPSTKRNLKEGFIKRLKEFEKNASSRAEEVLISLQQDIAVRANLYASHQLEQCS